MFSRNFLRAFFLPGKPAGDGASIADNFRKASVWLGALAFALGALSGLNWIAVFILHYRLRLPFPVQPLAAIVCFMLVGAGVLSVRRIPHSSRVFQASLGLLAFGIGFFSVDVQRAGAWQMDVLTAWVILLLGFSLMAGGSRLPVIGYARQLTALAVFFICGIVVLGYVYDLQNPQGFASYLHMSWLSALTGLIAGHALLFQHPNFGVMRVLTGSGFGSHMLRRLLPTAMLLLAGIGWLLESGENLGLYPASFGGALYSILAISGFACVLVLAANYLNRLDTQRVDQEKSLRRDQQLLQAIVDTLPSLICVKDTSGTFQTVNKTFCDSKGKPPEYFLGRNIFDLFPEESARRIQSMDREAIRKGGPVEHVEAGLMGDNRMYIAVRLPMTDSEGNVYGICSTYTDITEMKRQEAEIQALNVSLGEKTRRQEAANRELEAFSYSVSHDLRAPLRHIAGFGQLLAQRNREILDEKSRHYLDVILTSVGRMGNLIDDLLAFSRANKTELVWRRIPMEELVREVRTELEAGWHGPAVSWDMGPLPDAEGDPAMLRLAWVNLLSNAMKYSGKNPAPRILVHCVPDGKGELIFSVRDNGAGFDMRYADKLFGVFQRLHSSQEYEGTGIGLALVRRILERHGGRIWAESSPGNGASFHFALPAARPAAEPRTLEHGAPT